MEFGSYLAWQMEFMSPSMARIHTGFHRFTEISRILQNVSGTQEVDFESPKYYLGEHAPDPSRGFRLRCLFRKSVTIDTRSAPAPPFQNLAVIIVQSC